MTEVKAVYSKELSKYGDDRYIIINPETGEILDNAQGFGYKSAQNANFTGANLSKANFKDAYLNGAIFKNADLTETYFNHASFKVANFEGANTENIKRGDSK